MIAQRRQKQSDAEKKRAYEDATKRDGDLCQKCLRDCGHGVTSRDHRQDRDPFNTVVSNLQVLGGTGTTGCHGRKTTHKADAIREGWAMPRHTRVDSSEWPARRWLQTGLGTVRLAWVLYLNAPDGGAWWVEISDAEAARRMSDAGWDVAA